MTEPHVERQVVRVVLIDPAGLVLLLSTRDASNPAFGSSWELPGGGIENGENYADAAVREVWEETGIRINPDQVGEPRWRRHVSYPYRGKRRYQHEVIAVVRLSSAFPEIETCGRIGVEHQDHLEHRWWSVQEIECAGQRFYPRSLPENLGSLLAGNVIEEPEEEWG
jgi:8-oxo-dGTP pyrophosphatase MutT (NUDIX family)